MSAGQPTIPLGQLLFDQLRSQIVEGQHEPGSRLSVEDIKTRFGVSKQPVMEALRRLETMGLVEIAPQSGCRIRRYSRREAHDFFGVFASFESEIAAAAAIRHEPSELEDLSEALDQLHRLEAADRPGGAAGAVGRSRAYFELNAAFHQAIHQMARSPLVAELSQSMWYLSDFLMYTHAGAGAIAADLNSRNHDHDLILIAIRGRNATVARAAMDEHIRSITGLFAPGDG
jgi:DNA-binding GntR family transcriptional regulator